MTLANRLLFAALLALFSLLPTAAFCADEEDALEGLEWRLVGPWRGGRVTTVSGVPGQPNLYYMGATGGGVWKTENAGVTWENLSDEHFKVGTIGAVAVARSDPNVIYVGTGESPIRGVTTSHGDGVWKSTDAGKTWTHLGLKDAGQIARIQVHPSDPDIAYIGVQGQIWGPSEQRGVFRTTDGGKTWQQVLKVGPRTGTSDLRMDPTNPRILYAGMWNHGRTPWFIHSGGTDGGIFRTTDGGDSWTKLEGGLPEMIGKVGVDVSASNPQRVYAIIEAEPGQGGLWRSDDGGESWELINGHRALHTRAWYYIHIAADPVNENTVWVLSTGLYKSIDGGKEWELVKTPHGDHHDQWINPENSLNIISGNDGGATITFDGGETWYGRHRQRKPLRRYRGLRLLRRRRRRERPHRLRPRQSPADLRHLDQRRADRVRPRNRAQANHHPLPRDDVRQGLQGFALPRQLECARGGFPARPLGHLLRHAVPADEQRSRHHLDRDQPGLDPQRPREAGPQRRSADPRKCRRGVLQHDFLCRRVTPREGHHLGRQ
jgi:photosystem II stability/assembly factor-like uncharacterized protein